MPYRTKGNQESKAIGNLYCEKNHKGNWEILGNDGNREKLGITGNWETMGNHWQLGIRNRQSRESSGNPAIQGMHRQFRESTGNLAILGNACT